MCFLFNSPEIFQFSCLFIIGSDAKYRIAGTMNIHTFQFMRSSMFEAPAWDCEISSKWYIPPIRFKHPINARTIFQRVSFFARSRYNAIQDRPAMQNIMMINKILPMNGLAPLSAVNANNKAVIPKANNIFKEFAIHIKVIPITSRILLFLLCNFILSVTLKIIKIQMGKLAKEPICSNI